MKKFSILFFVACLTVNLFGQAPQSFKYQAVARDLSGNVLANKLISFRISILSGSVSGTLVYSEAHNGIVSNTFGLIDLAVGKGIPLSGSFASISWGTDNHFVRIELDPNGGSNYSVVGSCQLLSVPYALYAEKSGSNTSFLQPVVTASSATGIDLTSATLNGTVNGNGFKTEVTFEWGTSTLFGNKLKAIQDPVLGNTFVAVSLKATGLQPYTTYYYRISASNAVNTVLSNVIQFSKGITAPTLTTKPVTSITQNTAQTGGDILSTGGASITVRGVCWNTTGNPTVTNNITSDGTDAGSFTSILSGLTPATTYYVRAYATNSEGTGYGSQVSFTTSQSSSLPAVTTQVVSSFTFNTANVGGNVTSAGSSKVTERGVVYGTSTNPTLSNSKVVIGNGLGTFSGIIDNLVTNTLYYVRAYATNSSGTTYGNQESFTLNMNVAGPTVTDIDGNIYKTVKIGSQIWMAENLKTSKYKNGELIPMYLRSQPWSQLTTGAYFNYNDMPTNSITFGKLFNWYAVTDSRGICPSGWHVATDAEWQIMADYLGGVFVAGGKLKDIGTTYWVSPNTGATNESGFTAIPGATREWWAETQMGAFGYWWTAPEPNVFTYWRRSLVSNEIGLGRESSVSTTGYSVRCIKDSGNQATLPTVSTSSATNITNSGATLGGSVVSDGNATVTERGIVYSITQNPTTSNSKVITGSGLSTFSTTVTGLTPNTTYYAKAYAINTQGTAYGSEISFATLALGNIADVDGNTYKTITIGNQTWFSENLKATKFNDGSVIPNITDGVIWYNSKTPAYSWYNNDIINKNLYGALYNWYTVDPQSNGGKNVCPVGWHVPSDQKWTTMELFLINNGYGYGGSGMDIAKSLAEKSGWNYHQDEGVVGNNQSLNNLSGFSAKPAGERNANNSGSLWFSGIGTNADWWCAPVNNEGTNWSREIAWFSGLVGRGYFNKEFGLSIRCLKD